jgi:hypothetical protein
MRVLHVVTWVGPGNPFGGPVVVAENLGTELAARGHEVVLIAGASSDRRPSGEGNFQQRHFRGFKLLPSAGFSGVFSPGLLWFVARNARSMKRNDRGALDERRAALDIRGD